MPGSWSVPVSTILGAKDGVAYRAGRVRDDALVGVNGMVVDAVHDIGRIFARRRDDDALGTAKLDVCSSGLSGGHLACRLEDGVNTCRRPVELARISLAEQMNQTATEQQARWRWVVKGRRKQAGVVDRSDRDLPRLRAGTMGRVVLDGIEQMLVRKGSVIDGDKVDIGPDEREAEKGSAWQVSSDIRAQSSRFTDSAKAVDSHSGRLREVFNGDRH